MMLCLSFPNASHVPFSLRSVVKEPFLELGPGPEFWQSWHELFDLGEQFGGNGFGVHDFGLMVRERCSRRRLVRSLLLSAIFGGGDLGRCLFRSTAVHDAEEDCVVDASFEDSMCRSSDGKVSKVEHSE